MCYSIFSVLIWSHLFVNLTTQSLILEVLTILSSIFLLAFSLRSKSPYSQFMTCAKQLTGMMMGDVKLLEKSGGKGGTWIAELWAFQHSLPHFGKHPLWF